MSILIISPTANILVPKGGGQVRINSIATQLKEKGWCVVCFEPEDPSDDQKKDFGFKVIRFKKYTPPFLADLNPFFYYKLYKILKDENIDIMQVSFPAGIIATKIITKLLNLRKPIFYDAHNVEGYKVKNVKLTNLPLYKRIVAPFYIPILERIAVKLTDHIISVSHEDKELFIKNYDVTPERISVIPSGTVILNLESFKDRNTVRGELGIKPNEIAIVFHGTYKYSPNKEAIGLITDYVAPKIGELYKNVRFLIAGKDIPEFERGNLKGFGFVENLHDFLNASDIAIAPLLQGGGTKLKIIDYMGVGLPIVSTKKGMEGLNAKNGEHAIIVDDVDEDFIGAIKYLVDNVEERKRLGANARRLAEEEYDWDKIGKKLDGLYKSILMERLYKCK